MGTQRWSPGIGDPTAAGWMTVIAYFVAAFLCLWAGRRQPGATKLWWGLCAFLIALGINKQLDLQSWVTQLGRDLASSGNWYQQRDILQRWFVGAISLAAIGASVGAYTVGRLHSASVRTALAGAALLIAFVVVRAASFHHVDLFLGSRVLGARFNSILELSGITIVAGSALAAIRATRVARSGNPS